MPSFIWSITSLQNIVRINKYILVYAGIVRTY